MDWFQVLVIVFGNAAWTVPMWLWARAESRADNRQMISIVEAIIADSKAFQTAMAQESKDFHGRLCTIEERNKK
jgi:hypothetical protein